MWFGGLKVTDPAADLAICMAIASAAAERRLGDKTVVFGEIGLGGEVRSVPQIERRVAEAKNLASPTPLAQSQLMAKLQLLRQLHRSGKP